MYVAAAGGKVWFGYGPDGGHGGLGSLDPAIGQSSVTLGVETGWYNAPMLTATSDVVALADPYTTSGFVEIFNVLNASTVLTQNENFGAQWLQPQIIAQGRRAQVGGQIDF